MHSSNYQQNPKTLLRQVKANLNERQTDCEHGWEDSMLLRCQFTPNSYRDST